MASALGHIVQAAPSGNNPFSQYYTADGMALRFQSAEQLKSLFATELAKSPVTAYADTLQYPVEVKLNVAWSVTAPLPDHRNAFEVGLAFQITGAQMDLTRCTRSPAGEWQPQDITAGDTCLFSRYFTSRDLQQVRTQNETCARWLMALQSRNLDTLALFPQPFMISFPMKYCTRRFTNNDGQAMEEQRWTRMQSCTNCLASGTYTLCTWHVISRGWMQNDTAAETRVVRQGAASDLDTSDGAPLYQLFHRLVGGTSLVSVTD